MQQATAHSLQRIHTQHMHVPAPHLQAGKHLHIDPSTTSQQSRSRVRNLRAQLLQRAAWLRCGG